MPKEKNSYFFSEDAESMDYYLVRLMAANDCLLAMKDKLPKFRTAMFEASHKEMLTLYTLLTDLEENITEMKSEQVFRSSREEGRLAALEVLPQYLIEND